MDGVRTMRQKTREQRRKLMRKQKLYYEEMDAYMDAMSAICAVVDDIKMRRGLGV